MSAQDPSSIGNLVIELGYCTPRQVREGLSCMNGQRRLGETLIEMGYLTKHQLDWALTYQGMERQQVNGRQVQAFVRQQRAGLANELREIADDVRDLTAKINDKHN